MPARLQLRPLFEVIEQLAVEDHEDVPVLVGHRLLAVRQADDAEPARGQRDSRSDEETLFIRAAMHRCARAIRSTTSSGHRSSAGQDP